MALSNVNFDDLSESHLQNLVSTGVPEGVLLEYKSTTYGGSDADVKEYLKDVSSFANAYGGDLVIGIEQEEGCAKALLKVSPDKERQRLESLARDGIDPRIVGIRIKDVPLSDEGVAFVIRIPKSWNPPHRVSARGTNRFYARNSAGAYELSIEELRVIFASGATTIDRMRAFKAERLARLDADQAIVPLVIREDRLVMHLVPLASFGLGESIDLAQAHAMHYSLRPMAASTGFTPRINFEGFINIAPGANARCGSYTQIFRNGIVEAVKAGIITKHNDGTLTLPGLAFDEWIFEVLPNYLMVLRDLGVPAPITIMLSLQGVRGAYLATSPNWRINSPPAFNRSVLELPEVIIEQYGTDIEYQRAVRPAFDALWNAAGQIASKHFDSEGHWIKSPKS
jgi:hypothetical protein